MSGERLWTRDFITATVINFLAVSTYLFLLVCIASYAVDTFNASTNTAGLVASIFILGALIGRIGTGRTIDGIGSKRILVAGLALLIVTTALYFAASTVALLIAIRCLQGVAYGMASTATGTIIAHIVPDSRRGEGIGYYSLSIILATAFAPFAGIFLMQHVDFTVIFHVALALAVLGLVISLGVREPERRFPRKEQTKAVKGFQLSNFIEYHAVPAAIIALLIGFSYSIMLSFMSLYTKQIHLEQAASLYFLVYSVASLFSRPMSGRLFDIRGANFVIYPCLLIFAGGMFLFSKAGNSYDILLAGVLNGLGYGSILSCIQAVCVKSSPQHRFGLATATYFIFIDFGIGIGPYVLGFLVPYTGYRGLYLLSSLLILATIPLYYVLHGRKPVARHGFKGAAKEASRGRPTGNAGNGE